MKKLILSMILFLTTATLFLSPKADAQTSTDCHKVYNEESYPCLTENTKCLKFCVDKGTAAMSLTVDGAKVSMECQKTVCDPAKKACNDKAVANFRACQDAKAAKESQNETEPPLREFSPDILEKTPVTIGEWFNLVSLGITLRDFFSGMAVFSDYVMFEGERQEIREEEAMKEVAAQRRLEEPKFFPAIGKEEFIFVTYLDKPDVVNQPIDVLGRDDIKVYPWGEGNGAAVQSNDWGNIKFRKPVEVNGVTSHVFELEQGAVEVKVKNDNPSENKFGVDAGWLGVTVSRTHFWVSKDSNKNVAVVGVYEGEVEVKTKDGQIIKVAPNGDEPGVVIVTQKLSPVKLTIIGLVIIGVIGGVILILRRNFTLKGFSKKRK